MPTEDEWTTFAKAGENYTYSGSDDIDKVAWYFENSKGQTHPVCKKDCNGWKLFDMNGNAREWVWANKSQNSGFTPIAMGGAWDSGVIGSRNKGGFCSLTYDADSDSCVYAPEYRCATIGFRIVTSGFDSAKHIFIGKFIGAR